MPGHGFLMQSLPPSFGPTSLPSSRRMTGSTPKNARLALQFAQRGYVIESGRLVLEGRSQELLENAEVKKAYLGG